jgi:hypothetical protein
MVQFIAKLWHLHLADSLTVRGRLGIDVNNQQRIVQLAAGRV